MDLQEAAAALAQIPEVDRVMRASLKPGDVIVIESDQHLSVEAGRRIEEAVQRIWPDRRVVVLSAGLRLKVVDAEQVG